MRYNGNMEVCTLTLNPCLDRTLWVEAFGLPPTREEWQTGGKGVNVARVLASSGERIDAIDGHIEDLKKLDPAYIFLCYGINDLGWYGSAQDYADTLLEKIRLLRRELPEAVIVVSSILPAYEPAVSREKLWLQIPDYTAAVQAMCEENGVLFADNTQLSEDYADLWQPDGIHLLPEFYPHWAANLIFASWGEIADA